LARRTPVINVSQTEVLEALVQLDRAIHNHGEWFDAVTRTLVCRLPHDPKDVAPDAHCQCRLGQWYYGNPSDALRRHPGFAALEAEHKDMHQKAAGLLQAAADGVQIPADEFDGLARALARVRLQLHTLKRELEGALHNLDSLTGASTRDGMLPKLREQHVMVERRAHDCCARRLPRSGRPVPMWPRLRAARATRWC
jgi:diguanylate cyclase